jgi:hypothetical protein
MCYLTSEPGAARREHPGPVTENQGSRPARRRPVTAGGSLDILLAWAFGVGWFLWRFALRWPGIVVSHLGYGPDNSRNFSPGDPAARTHNQLRASVAPPNKRMQLTGASGLRNVG